MRYLILLYLLIITKTIFAEGSKDLYPAGVRGARAYIVSGRSMFNNGPVENGAHYAWVKKGEIIAVASSAQNIGNGSIEVISPSGIRYQTTNNDIGKIQATGFLNTRQAELAGPRIGYTPLEINATEEGIWSIKFYAPYATTEGESAMVQANAIWLQEYDAFIAAWDISIRDITDSNWINGRVFTHSLTLSIHSRNLERSDGSGGYYGKNYILTNDAVIYRVDANGNHGLGFSYFANNLGFIDSHENPIYKSINQYDQGYHYPFLADTDKLITHKLFYNLPDSDLPKESIGQYPGNKTWLLNKPVVAEVNNIRIVGIEGRENHISKKGAWISFDSSYKGRYQIAISSKSSQHQFVTIKMVHSADIGANKIYWNGLDGNSQMLPVGKGYPIEVDISLLDGEVHFPFLDIEVNPQGLLVERFELSGKNLGYSTLYWDDSDISPGIPSEMSNPLINLEGILSNINGHKWGSYKPTDWSMGTVNSWYGSHSFGNGKGMDTWTYNLSINSTYNKNITVAIHDLQIESISTDKDVIDLNESYWYTVKIKNEGPSGAESAYFSFTIPEGLLIESFTSSTTCATSLQDHLNTSGFSSTLDIPSGCEVSYQMKVKVVQATEEFYFRIPVQGSIVRSADSTDPDAISLDLSKTSPGSAEEECLANCNNIKRHDKVMLIEPEYERGKIGLVKTVDYFDSNKDGIISKGDQLEYKFRVKNLGQTPLQRLALIDEKLSSTPIWSPNLTLKSGEERLFTYKYVLTESDIVNNIIINSAHIEAYNPRNRITSDISGSDFGNDNPTVFSFENLPVLKLKKTVQNVGTGEEGQFTVGDIIQYRFEIKHIGDKIADVKIVDKLISDSAFHISLLKSNGLTNYVANYLITEQETINSKIINTASVLGIETKYNTIIKDISGHSFEDDLPTETSIAQPYITSNDNYTIYEGERLRLDFLQNDKPGSSNIDRIDLLGNFQHGHVIADNNSYFYTPSITAKNVMERVHYQILDKSRLRSNQSYIQINIKKTEAIATNDSIRINHGLKSRLYPLRNDYSNGSEIDPTSIEITVLPKSGKLLLNSDGSIDYIPDTKFTGIDYFEYQVSDKNGNKSEAARYSIQVTGLFIPNVISPNEDGINDSFFIIGANQYDKLELRIFNRLGVEVLNSADYQNNWTPDKKLDEGTYYYILKVFKLGNAPYTKKGSLLIVRDLKFH